MIVCMDTVTLYVIEFCFLFTIAVVNLWSNQNYMYTYVQEHINKLCVLGTFEDVL